MFGYNNEGQRTSLKYPDITDDSGYVVLTGKTVTSSFDSFGRPLSLNDGTDLVRNGAWSLAGRLTGMEVRNGAVYEARTWTYNNLGQLTGQTATGVNLEYTYPAVNDGRLLKRKDNISGEEVAYQYDEIGRLISAATTAPTGGWGLAWVYDGFGNRLQQNVTKGSAYSMQLTVNAATNRLSGSGFAYDANGNQTGWSTPSGPVTAVYDVDNRMASITTPSAALAYHYSAANQRLRKPRDAASEDIFFYGLGGELLGAYGRYNGATSFYPSAGWQKEYVYFAGVQVLPAAVEDRVGSVVKSAEWGGTSGYFPYGEQLGGASGDDRKKFGTYWRDSASGLDYAQNRYYAAAWGRFTSADPYVMSGGLGNPQGWNRYAYVGGDPVNINDPTGLLMADPSGDSSAPNGPCGDNWIWDASLVGPCPGGTSGSGWSGSGGGGASSFTADAGTMRYAVPFCLMYPEVCVVVAGGAAIYVTWVYVRPFVEDLTRRWNSGTIWQNRTPASGEPNSTVEIPTSGGKTVRRFGPDGRAAKDIDYGHDHGSGNPHAHDWDWSKNPPRQPGRPLGPGEN